MREQEKQLALNFEKLGAESISLALVDAFSSPAMQHVPLLDVLLEASEMELAKRRDSRGERLLKMAKLQIGRASCRERV